MGETSEIRAFLERAKINGISDDAIVGILTARGWSEKDVYQSLAAHYEELTGIKIPVRRSAGTAAKDAFFYLLTFSALATWTIALGSLAFTLINRWFTDNLFSPGYPQHLDELQRVVLADPATRSAYGYRPKENSKYQLCATFSGASPQDGQSSVWAHPSGYYCFSFDASQPTPGPPYVFDPLGF